jgi:hypothetical protein
MRVPGLVIGLLLIGLVVDTVGPLSAQPPPVLERILTDSKLWGEDAFALFASLDRWRAAGETQIMVYPDRVVAVGKAETPDQARQRLAQMTAALQRPQPALRSPFAAVYAGALAARAPAFRADVQRLLEDESFRVVWTRPDAQFLRRGTTSAAAIAAYGKPEKTTTEVVHGRGERRPAVLTLYHYANSAIVFVESDLAPTPGLVDRVVLDVAAATALIFAPTP